jgi:hypothetical protein
MKIPISNFISTNSLPKDSPFLSLKRSLSETLKPSIPPSINKKLLLWTTESSATIARPNHWKNSQKNLSNILRAREAMSFNWTKSQTDWVLRDEESTMSSTFWKAWMLFAKRGKITTNGEACLRLSGPSTSVSGKARTTRFKISRRKSHFNTWQVDSSSFSSAGNPPFLLSKQQNKWWKKWTKPQSEPRSEDSTISSTSSGLLDWSRKLRFLPKSLDMNGQEPNFWNIWSWKNNNATKTPVWMSWTTMTMPKTLRKRPVRCSLPKTVCSVHLFARKPQNHA